MHWDGQQNCNEFIDGYHAVFAFTLRNTEFFVTSSRTVHVRAAAGTWNLLAWLAHRSDGGGVQSPLLPKSLLEKDPRFQTSEQALEFVVSAYFACQQAGTLRAPSV